MKRKEIKCYICGKSFSPSYYNQKNCSAECSKMSVKKYKYENAQKHHSTKEHLPKKVVCLICNNEFEARAWNQKTCSFACSIANKESKKQKISTSAYLEKQTKKQEKYKTIEQIQKEFVTKHKAEMDAHNKRLLAETRELISNAYKRLGLKWEDYR